MTKKTITILLTFFVGLVLFGGHASGQSDLRVHIATAYYKTGNRYNIVAKGTSGDKLKLYVNDKSPSTTATVDKDGWTTFNAVKLIGSGKISFTQVLSDTKNNDTYQQPINFTEHYTIANQTATFTYNNIHIHVATAYYDSNNQYDIVVKNNPSETLELYVNDKSPTKATVNDDDWATFRNVQLPDGSGKISFTHVYARNNSNSFQWPINFTEHYVAADGTALFTPNKLVVKKAAPKPTPKPIVITPTPTPAPAPAPAPKPSCHPLTNGGNCYEPGEYCRDDNHGDSGIAGDGKSITCEDNNGWRWEP